MRNESLLVNFLRNKQQANKESEAPLYDGISESLISEKTSPPTVALPPMNSTPVSGQEDQLR